MANDAQQRVQQRLAGAALRAPFARGLTRTLYSKELEMKFMLIVIFLTFSINAHAYDKERAVSNLASELSECVAYYSLITMQMGK